MKHTRIVTEIHDGLLPMPARRQLAGALAHVKDGTQVVVELFEVPRRRTAAQNDGFHAMITPWAKDEGHDIDDLKRDLLGTVFGWKESPIGETRVPRKPHTSDLTVEEFSELITRSVDIAARCGYQLLLPSEYLDHQWAPRPRQESL